MTESRKRIRSDEESYGLQSKYFVNQQLVEKSDKVLMQKVYEKTLNMIFAGAKAQAKADPNKTTPMESSIVLDTVDDKLPEPQGCMLCWKDVDKTSNTICKNCNLKVCDNCHTNCLGCDVNLCNNCVNIFGCSLDENPFCEDCKLFID